jgi:hypothetical protein
MLLTSKLVLYTERTVLDCVYGFFKWLCFFRGAIAMLLSWGHCNAFFVCLFLRAAARARYTFGATSMLYSSVIACEQRPAPAVHLGPLLCFLSLEHSLSQFSDVLFRKTNRTTKSRKTTKNAVPMDRS